MSESEPDPYNDFIVIRNEICIHIIYVKSKDYLYVRRYIKMSDMMFNQTDSKDYGVFVIYDDFETDRQHIVSAIVRVTPPSDKTIHPVNVIHASAVNHFYYGVRGGELNYSFSATNLEKLICAEMLYGNRIDRVAAMGKLNMSLQEAEMRALLLRNYCFLPIHETEECSCAECDQLNASNLILIPVYRNMSAELFFDDNND